MALLHPATSWAKLIDEFPPSLVGFSFKASFGVDSGLQCGKVARAHIHLLDSRAIWVLRAAGLEKL